jgi:glycosyltransferase involved in cell wall biosynthesis
MTTKTELIVLTAVYNDWDSFKVLLAQLEQCLEGKELAVRVVVVDDGSSVFADEVDFSDISLKIIEEIKVITLTRNMGNQRAQSIGIAYIGKYMQCDFLVTMDSDLEDRPEYVPQLLDAAIGNGNKIIFAERTQRPEGLLFKLFYQSYKGLYKLFTGMSISMGNFCIIPGRLVRRVAGTSEIWNHFPAGIMKARIPFQSIPSQRGERLMGESKMNMVSLVIHGLSGLAAHADVVGVRAVLGILIAGIIIVGMIAMIVVGKIFTDIFLIGWPSQIVAILGGALLQIFVAAVFIVFLVLVGRHTKLIIPSVDFLDYILEVTTLPISFESGRLGSLEEQSSGLGTIK